MNPASIDDYRDLARQRLPRFLFDYIDGGAFAETTLRRNTHDFEQIALRQRVLRDVSQIDLTTDLFGERASMPLILGPVGLAGLFARRGEVQAARAAEKAGVPFCLSTVSLCAVEEVSKASDQAIWFQLYMIKDRGFMRELLHRAQTAGCTTLVFTVDLQVASMRYRDIRSGLNSGNAIGPSLHRLGQIAARPRWAWNVGLRGRPHSLGNVVTQVPKGSGIGDFWKWVGKNFDPSVTWKDLDWIRQSWKGHLVTKGVLAIADARPAAMLGADGIVVSNHGGRQLDGVLSSIRALPAISQAVADRLTVLMDGGVRSGLDVIRALALGADGVLLGRAWVYALAAAGGKGVTHALETFRHEMRLAIAMTGHCRPSELDQAALERPAFSGADRSSGD